MNYKDKKTKEIIKQAKALAEQNEYGFLDLIILNIGEHELRGMRKRHKTDEIIYNFDALFALGPGQFVQYLSYKEQEYRLATVKDPDYAEIIRGQILSLNKEYTIRKAKVFEQDALIEKLDDIRTINPSP